MTVRIYHVDAFTEKPFAGNPASICMLREPREEAWMQSLAREMNLSETAFLVRQGRDFELRWFTPTVEVELCGHATLASAHILWETGTLSADESARFRTKSGLLIARKTPIGIEMDFPATPDSQTDPLPGLIEALGVDPVYCGKGEFDYLIEIESEEDLLDLRPDFIALAEIPIRGVVVTCRCDSPPYDFVSRFFAPAAGINEDPVTGSAHCALGPYWNRKTGKTEFLAYQASERGGVVGVRMAEDDRVILVGRAVTIFQGELVS